MAAPITRNPMRARFREQVRQDVKSAALQQLADGGPQAISINAIAKQLGVSGPALYRYFANRDDLLTALIIDAYHDLRDALAQRIDRMPHGQDSPERVRVLAEAYRTWATTEPHRYELLFKPPLPGYDAHAEPLVDAAQSVMAIVLQALQPPARAERTPDDNRESATVSDENPLGAPATGTAQFQFALSLWSRLHGFVGLELGGNFRAMQVDDDALFENELRSLLELLDQLDR